jgi:hypothetical protein
MLNSKCKAKQRRKKSKVKKQERIKKHELCPLAKRPSPQVLCNECIPNKIDLANENQKPKKVE